MTHPQIILYALAAAFFVVEALPRRIRLQQMKPLNCMMCMTGWFTLALCIAVSVVWWECLLLALVGVMSGAIFGAIKMRWL